MIKPPIQAIPTPSPKSTLVVSKLWSILFGETSMQKFRIPMYTTSTQSAISFDTVESQQRLNKHILLIFEANVSA